MNDVKEKNIRKIPKKPKSAIFNKLKEFNLRSICTSLKNKIDENKDDNNEKENQNIKQKYFVNNNIFDQKNNNGNK